MDAVWAVNRLVSCFRHIRQGQGSASTAAGAATEREEESETLEELEARARASVDAATQPRADIESRHPAELLPEAPPQNLEELVQRVRRNVDQAQPGRKPAPLEESGTGDDAD